ncbi:putative proline racemase [Octadecabacter antarcticus 307]|uniref:Putative proline racemase n=2 Tax=Octadecabacter TaxID=53945 RepID=M9QZH6_9RHOB|nr:putative proline racemase [Octadecabacter antarcticus 307]
MRMQRMITAVEAHAEGEGGRVITGGMPVLKGNSVFEKMRYMQDHHDDIRLLMLREPRGNPALCCNAIVPPCDPSADAGFIIMEQTEYPPMSGSNAICVATVLLETGIVAMVEPVTMLRLEAPAGVIEVKATCKDGKVERVEFMNVPAFAAHIGVPLDVPGFGTVEVDIAWGGMWFVIAEAAQFGIDPRAKNGGAVVRAIEAMRDAAVKMYPMAHPDNPDLAGPTIGQLTAPATDPATHGRSAVSVSSGVFDPSKPEALTGALDRSPCGTGTCAKLAVLHAKGLLAVGEDYVNAGPLGTTFTGRIEGVTKVGPYDAIIPSLSGRGWIYGVSQWMLDPADPFPDGFTVGDIWG